MKLFTRCQISVIHHRTDGYTTLAASQLSNNSLRNGYENRILFANPDGPRKLKLLVERWRMTYGTTDISACGWHHGLERWVSDRHICMWTIGSETFHRVWGLDDGFPSAHYEIEGAIHRWNHEEVSSMCNALGLSEQKLSVRLSTLIHIPEKGFWSGRHFPRSDCQSRYCTHLAGPTFGYLLGFVFRVYRIKAEFGSGLAIPEWLKTERAWEAAHVDFG